MVSLSLVEGTVAKLDDYLHITEAAKYVGVCINTLRNWETAGKLRVYRNPLNRYRFNTGRSQGVSQSPRGGREEPVADLVNAAAKPLGPGPHMDYRVFLETSPRWRGCRGEADRQAGSTSCAMP